MKRYLLALLGTLILLSTPPTRVNSQGTLLSRINGQTREVAGAGTTRPLEGVSITLTNLALRRERVEQTSRKGIFQFLNLRPGNYRIGVHKEGYQLGQPRRASVIRLRVNEPVRVLPAYELILIPEGGEEEGTKSYLGGSASGPGSSGKVF